MEEERYVVEALAYSVRSDFEFIRWLVDVRGMPAEILSNRMARILYVAASGMYAKRAPSGERPLIGDVIGEIASISSREIADKWQEKIEQMSTPSSVMPREMVDRMIENYERTRVNNIVTAWMESPKSGNRESTRQAVTRLTDSIMDVLIGLDAAGRPKAILDDVWGSGVRTPQSTGYSRINTAIDGGWTPGQFYLWGMPSGHGKSSLCCNFASRRAEAGLPTIINSFEMSSFDLLARMICDIASVGINIVEAPHQRASDNEMKRIISARDLIDKYVRIYDRPANTQELERRTRRHIIEFDGLKPLVEVDHIGIVQRSNAGNDWAEIESLAYGLKDMAKVHGIPVLAYSQIPDGAEQELVEYNQVFYNKDYRGSRGLRNAIDYGFMGCRHNGKVRDGNGNVAIAPVYRHHTVIQVVKNRKTGTAFWGVFLYVPEFYRLTDTRNPNTEEDKHL